MTDLFTPQTREPASILIGTFCAWTTTDTFDPADYSAKYVFSQDNWRKEVIGAYTDGLWTFTVDASISSDLEPGRCILDMIVTRLSDGETALVRTSTVRCFATAADRTSHAQVMVDKIEGLLSGRADNDVESYTIKSRSISKMSVRELTDWREYYLAELGREPDPFTGRRKNSNTIYVGFV